MDTYLKTCPGPCGKQLPLDQFSIQPSRPGGRNPYCRTCSPLVGRRVAKRRAAGLPTITNLIDAEPARQHVLDLCTRGMTRHQIGELAGVDRTSIRNLLVGQPSVGQGPAKRLRATTAARLLAVTFTPCVPAPVPPGKAKQAGATVDNTGTRRRIEALLANGWTSRDLAARLGMKGRNLQLPKHRRVTSSTAAAVRALYDELADTPGPSQRAATLYRGRGYLHPGWWDPDTIDDPDAEPAGIRERLTTPSRWPVELDRSRPWPEQATVLAKTGMSNTQIAEQLRTSPKQIRRARAAA